MSTQRNESSPGVLQCNAEFYRAFRDGDTAAMERLWTTRQRDGVDTATCVHPGHGTIAGRAAVMDGWRQIMSSGSPSIRPENVKVRRSHDLTAGLNESHPARPGEGAPPTQLNPRAFECFPTLAMERAMGASAAARRALTPPRGARPRSPNRPQRLLHAGRGRGQVFVAGAAAWVVCEEHVDGQPACLATNIFVWDDAPPAPPAPPGGGGGGGGGWRLAHHQGGALIYHSLRISRQA